MSRKSSTKDKTEKSAHPIRKEIRGLIFLLVAIILGGSLLFYNPGDQLFWNVTGPLGKAHNLFGTVGAHLAGGVFFLVGFSSFWLVIIALTMAFLSFRGRHVSSPVKSTVAALTLLVSFSAILSLQLSDVVSFRGGQILAGGLVGVYLAELTKSFLNFFGAYVFFLAIFIISLMIVSHLSLGWLFSRLGLWIMGVFRHIKEVINKKRERKKRSHRTTLARKKMKSKPKVTIVKPKREPEKRPEQERFGFMNVAGEFKLPNLDLLDDPPEREDTGHTTRKPGDECQAC